jgi:hypothetical protein
MRRKTRPADHPHIESVRKITLLIEAAAGRNFSEYYQG